MKEQIDEIQQKMQDLLPRKRYLHTEGVAYLAASFAMRYKEDMEKAMIAGLLHDNAKYIGDEKTIEECTRYHISCSDVELANPFLLHGKLGAYYAKHNYGIEDEAILSAIQWHTTGKPDMTFLEKAIFVADYIEPRRSQPTTPDLDQIRATAFEDLDFAVYYALDNTLRYLRHSNAAIDENSIESYEYYKTMLRL